MIKKIKGVKIMFLEGDALKDHRNAIKEQLDKKFGADRNEHPDLTKEHDLKLGNDKVW